MFRLSYWLIWLCGSKLGKFDFNFWLWQKLASLVIFVFWDFQRRKIFNTVLRLYAKSRTSMIMRKRGKWEVSVASYCTWAEVRERPPVQFVTAFQHNTSIIFAFRKTWPKVDRDTSIIIVDSVQSPNNRIKLQIYFRWYFSENKNVYYRNQLFVNLRIISFFTIVLH